MTKKEMLKIASFVFAAFSLISAFFQSLVIQPIWARWAIFGCSIAAGILSIIFFLKFKKYDNAIKLLSGILSTKSSSSKDYTLRPLRSEAELKEIWSISQSIYGDDNVDFTKVLSWWKMYPKGVYRLCDDHQIVGWISMWPLKKTSFDNIMNGDRMEREISYQSIHSEKSIKPRTNWYISNIVIQKKYRKTNAIKTLMRNAFNQWIQDGNLGNDIRICALAYSNEGEALLRRFGFSKYKDGSETRDHLPLYLYSSSLEDLDNLFARLI